MLNGIDPVIIFQFKSSLPKVSKELAKIPLISDIPTLVEEPPIPIYLSEQLTGLLVDTESKNIDASTQTETKTDGSQPTVNQKGVGSVVSVDLIANKNSIGVSLFTALAELAFEKLSSKEYSVTYLHGPITVFRGLIHSFSASQDANTTKMPIKFEISRGDATKLPSITNPKYPVVEKTSGTIPL